MLSQDRSFKECLNIASADAAEERETNGLTNSSVNYMKNKKVSKGKLKCFCCGSENHLARKYPIKSSGLTCSYCNKPNHLVREW